MDFPKKQAQRLMPLYLLEYSEKLFENHPNPEDPWGGGSDYTAGYGIDITSNEISVDTNVIATKSDIASMVTTSMLEDALDDYALKTDLPENVSDLNNDAGYTTQTWVENQGYITGINSSDVIAALGYTPGTSNFSGSYNDLTDTPTIGHGVLTIQVNGVNVKQFSANETAAKTANIIVPTKTSDLTNDSGFITGITSSDVIAALGYTPGTSNFSGSYNDLTNKPDLSIYAESADLATVATTGDYNDLINKPNIVNPHTIANGDLVFQATGTWTPAYKWFDDAAITSASSSFVDIITNFEADLILPEEFTQDGVLYAKRMVDGVQVDTHEFRYVYAIYSVSGEPAYIWFIYNDSLDTITSVTKQRFDAISYSQLTNILSSYVTSSTLTSTLSNYAQTSTLASVATTGNYNDLTSKPTIPDAVSGTNDGTNWTSLTIGNSTYDIPQGGSAPGMIGEVIFSRTPTTRQDVYSINLSKSITNYEYIEIYYNTINNANERLVKKIANPVANDIFNLQHFINNTNTTRLYTINDSFTITNATTITFNNSIQQRIGNAETTNVGSSATSMRNRPYKIIGYKQNSAPIVIPDFEYHNGNKFTNSNYMSSTGYITNGQKELTFTIIVPKLLTNITSVTVNRLECLLRGVGGYVNGSSNIDYASTSGYTINTYIAAPNAVTISVIKSSAYSSSTNNTPVNAAFLVEGLQLTFN